MSERETMTVCGYGSKTGGRCCERAAHPHG
mgnify:CR=1 FL=1